MAEVASPELAGPVALGRWRLWLSSFLVSFAICFGISLGFAGFIIVLGAIAVTAGLLWPRGERVPRRSRAVTAADVVVIWTAISVPFLTIGFGVYTLLALFFWVVSLIPVAVTAAVLVFVSPRQGLLACAAVLIGLAVTASGVTSRSTVRRLQVQVHAWQHPSEISDRSPYSEWEGVQGWIWVGGIPDGGAGPAYDPTDRIASEDFSVEAWQAITGDPGRCDLLFDHWYWCG